MNGRKKSICTVPDVDGVVDISGEEAKIGRVEYKSIEEVERIGHSEPDTNSGREVIPSKKKKIFIPLKERKNGRMLLDLEEEIKRS